MESLYRRRSYVLIWTVVLVPLLLTQTNVAAIFENENNEQKSIKKKKVAGQNN